jgi:hypothetical protein
MKRAARRPKSLVIPLTALIASLAVSVFGQARPDLQIAKLQKRRVVARTHLNGSKAIHQIVTWQTANPGGGHLPYAKAHLAIEAVGKNPRPLFQTDGGESQYLVDALQLADLDGDGILEITTLWWAGASAGAVLRVFHFDKTAQSFVELKSADELSGVHRYRIVGAGKATANRRIVIYTRSDVGSGSPLVAADEYELRNSQIMKVEQRGGKKNMDKENRGESGIEGEAVIGPTRPHVRLGDPTPDVIPFKTTLIILTAKAESEVMRFETGSDGRFRIALPPGEYLVRPVGGQGRMGPRASEENVTVRPGQFAKVRINFDNGMR